jgi:hypothetical protein
MFAFLGELSIIHWVIVFVIGLLTIAVPIFVVLLLFSQRRKVTGVANPDELAELRAEVERLRAEVERLKRGSTSS